MQAIRHLQSEYLAKNEKRRVWITGFTGSAGTAVITVSKAALWTDGRYFQQAEQQLDCNWILMRMGESQIAALFCLLWIATRLRIQICVTFWTGEQGVPSIEEWIISELDSGKQSGANPFLFSIGKKAHYIVL